MPTILGANTESAAYEISNSVIFYGGDSSISNNPGGGSGSDGSRTQFTQSYWVKRSGLGLGNNSNQQFITSAVATNNFYNSVKFNGNDQLQINLINSGSDQDEIVTNNVFRDTSAWYHIFIATDKTQAAVGDGIKIYVNGVLQTLATSTYAQNQGYHFFRPGKTHYIGNFNGSEGYFDGYFAEMHFIDGQVKAHTDFGELNDNGVWVPKKYSGSYGTYGAFLEFKQTGTSENSSGIGADTSGNDEHYAVANMDQHTVNVDTPTLNYCTLNAVGATDSQGESTNLANGALRISTNGRSQGLTMDNVMLDGGRWYFEVYLAGGSFNSTIGFRNADNGDDTPSIEIENDGQIKKDGSNQGSTDTAFSNGMVVGVIIDWSNTSSRKITFETNNSAHSEGQQTFSDSSSINGFQFHGRESGGVQIYNFGNTPAAFGNKTAGGNADGNGYGNFFYAVPSNHYAINSKNLAEYG